MSSLKESRLKWYVNPKEASTFLGDFLSKVYSVNIELSKSLIEFGCVYVNGIRTQDPGYKLAVDDKVELYLPSYGPKKFYEINPDRILYRDAWILAYNKEPFIPSHQVPYDDYNHVFGGLKRFLSREHPDPYVAIHNRLDAEVSGVLLFSVNKSVNRRLSKIFSSHDVRKIYLLWAEGTPPDNAWTCTKPLSKKDGKYCWVDESEKGKPAKTNFAVIYRKDSKFLIIAEPITGRTHQIRLHLLASGLRLCGDRLYDGPPAPRLMLHGWQMELRHPYTGKSLSIKAPIPDEFFLGEFSDSAARDATERFEKSKR
ncbi:MAG: RluA family pseudouridine synthase [Thermodesulforhabdaceae bacterium]